MATREEIDNVDAGLELRKVKALEKIALNTEAIAMFLENLDTDDWSDRIQWYLSMFKEAYLDDKLGKKEEK